MTTFLRMMAMAAMLLWGGPAGAAPGGKAPAAGKGPDAALVKVARRLEAGVARLRGLRLRRRVRVEVLTRGELVKLLEQKMARQSTDSELAAEEAVLRRLWLLPAHPGLRQSLLKLLGEDMVGFYDADKQRLYVVGRLPAADLEPVLVHELCHALVDQRFNLRRLVRPIRDNTDAQLARLALVEGDCTVVMLEHMMQKEGKDLPDPQRLGDAQLRRLLGQDPPPAAGKAEFLRELMLFPYLDGLRLVLQVRGRFPWSLVDKMYKRPPESSAQVLHYDKYWDGVSPARITPRPLPVLDGWETLRLDTLGEHVASLYLAGAGASDPEGARRAAEGWGGDRLQAFRAAGDTASAPLVVHLTRWDNDPSAREYFDAQRRLWVARKLTPEGGAGGAWTYRDPAGARWTTRLNGRYVLSLMGLPAQMDAASLEKQVWESWRVAGQRVKGPAPPPAAPGAAPPPAPHPR